MTSYGWEGNRRSSVHWPCITDFSGLSTSSAYKREVSTRLHSSKEYGTVFGRPFVKRFALCYRSVVCPVCLSSLSVCPVCNVGVLWANGWTGAELLPQFSAHVYCGQTAGWITVALGMEVGLGPGHIVLDGDTAPLPQKGTEPPPIFGPCLLRPNGWMD